MKTIFYQLFTFVAILISSTSLLSQEIIFVKGAKGEAAINGSISLNEARDQALQNAKIEALQKAGIAENLSSYEMLFKGEIGKDFTELFSSQTQSEIRGAVKSYTAVEEKFVDSTTQLFTIRVTIDAEVIRYQTEQDPEFQVQVEGINPLYSNNDKLQFTVRVTKSCFLTIFSVTENEASLIFPNKYETDMIALLLVSTQALGQMNDNFETGAIGNWTQSTAGRWAASSDHPIDGLYSLKHSYDNPNADVDFVGTTLNLPNITQGDVTWRFQVKHADSNRDPD